MDVKARSKAMREILTRLSQRAMGSIEVKVFGDKVILDEGGSTGPTYVPSC
jgi:inositol-hexakisphosphate/diphosphoinositol-pentakisphosphate 1-kinase